MLCKVAVTGGLSCGKSAVCKIFKDLGAYVISADEIVHRLLMSPKTPIGQQITSLLGPDVILDDHFDRRVIAGIVFKNQTLLKSLESILHPAVIDEIEKEYNKVKTQGNYPLFVAEIPLFFEATEKKKNQKFNFDYTITVTAPEIECVKRFKESTGYETQEYRRRMASQLPLHEKEKLANFTINNDSTLDDLHLSVEKIYKKIKKDYVRTD